MHKTVYKKAGICSMEHVLTPCLYIHRVILHAFCQLLIFFQYHFLKKNLSGIPKLTAPKAQLVERPLLEREFMDLNPDCTIPEV